MPRRVSRDRTSFSSSTLTSRNLTHLAAFHSVVPCYRIADLDARKLRLFQTTEGRGLVSVALAFGSGRRPRTTATKETFSPPHSRPRDEGPIDDE